MTIGLAIITNKFQETLDLISKYEQYFDEVYITVADKDQKLYNDLKKVVNSKKIKFSYFKWVNHFGKARLFNQAQIKTDLWFWMDTDDDIEHPELLKDLVRYMEQKNLDAIMLNYQYYTNEHGESEGDHWRERIIKTDGPFKWADVPCHETVTAPYGNTEKVTDVVVRHRKDVAAMKQAVQRNKALLEEDWPKTKDPRTAFYLGMTYELEGEYRKALEMFDYMIEKGGWDEQKVVALLCVADCHYFLHEYMEAIEATNMAIHLDPSHPDPWYQKAMIYSAMQDYEKAVHFVEIAMTKKPNENSMQLQDPTKYKYKGLFVAAQSYLMSGQVEKAFEMYRKIMEIAPHFILQNNTKDVNWNKLFEEAYYDQKAIEYTRYLSHYLRQAGGDATKLFHALPQRIYSDARLNAERVQVFPPKKWPEKTIAYYVGPGMEPWGPDTLEQGMGGSEEAVIYLSRELAKLGWQIHVFCDREEEFDDNGVIYHPWTELNPFDEFNVFIASRQAANVLGVRAKAIIVDLHDTMPEQGLKAVESHVNKFMVKSKWHRNLYPSIPDDKFVVVGNGILEEHFNG